ncbi:Cationic amino acid transporter 2 [Fragariocoptes setiger]|uniref:S-formylglutathione hydrolase n=1 Tax=Fragariocoptes setiger TaxID=1670756 RepID=A0ABQ7S8X8_9ACAR|nr:Cationic amino acid transporter 2 [Fragariocoptes setiger]
MSGPTQITEVSRAKCFNGHQYVYGHSSRTLGCQMKFGVFLPSSVATNPDKKYPVLYFLSGLTCTEQNFITKSGFQKFAEQYEIVVINPDTSPRGCNVPGEEESWDIGTGAGFYVDAQEKPWSDHYRMYSYVSQELLEVAAKNFPIDPERAGVTGHSMGGHGALIMFLKEHARFKSVSAFAPISNPINSSWGKKCFTHYLGTHRQDAWNEYDATELVKNHQYRRSNANILVDVGTEDEWESYLVSDNFPKACREAGQPVTFRKQEGYNHELSLAMRRRKPIQRASGSDTKLDRCLGTFDLTALGVGSTLGLGIYVLAGQAASKKAGPAVIISFIIAAFASILAGLCYAEFGARVPAAGSAYIYSYVSISEIMAFLIGWNLIVEYLIGTASGARGYSGYIDSLFDGKLHACYKDWFPFTIPGTNNYPDLTAAAITILVTILTAVGMKDSSRFNTVFTGINIMVVFYVIIVGSFYANFDNWNIDPATYTYNTSTSMMNDDTSMEDRQKLMGKGGFLPFGFSGVLAGAATCFYGFIGFDVIATTGEEVRNSKRAIPISIVLSLTIILLAYFFVSAIQTLMWPYWEQNKAAPLPYIFEKAGSPTSRYVITIGSLAGLSTSLLGALYPLPRVLYAMSSDGLIFRAFSRVNSRTRTPLFATIISGACAAVMASMFDLEELADMMSIGTLLAYSLVAISVLILRYNHEYPVYSDEIDNCIGLNDVSIVQNSLEQCSTIGHDDNVRKHSRLVQRLLNYPKLSTASKSTTSISCNFIWTVGSSGTMGATIELCRQLLLNVEVIPRNVDPVWNLVMPRSSYILLAWNT